MQRTSKLLNRENKLSKEVSLFLDALNHPLRSEIDLLRSIILTANQELTENIKWNGPNYCYENQDRISMRIQPPKQIQLIFHRGAKKLEQPKEKLIGDNSKILVWKENDRAVASFKNKTEIEKSETELSNIIKNWLEAAK